MTKSLQGLIKEYTELSKKNGIKNIPFIIRKFIVENTIVNRARLLQLFELLKEFRILYLGLNNNKYNPQVRAYTFSEYNCLEIYIKYNYIIKFNYNNSESFIIIEGNYSKNNLLSLEQVPYDIEKAIRKFVLKELIDLMNYIDSLNRR